MNTKTKDPRGGHNRKTLEQHVRDGTYRRDRHGPLIREQVFKSAGHRSCDWWQYESPEPRDESLPEPEQLSRMFLLTESELDELRASACGIVNQFSQRPFRRTWAWWKFLAPERRDWDTPEAVQLLTMPAELTGRENSIIATGKDFEGIEGLPHLGMTDGEREALGLPPASNYTWHRYTVPGYWPNQFGS